MHLTAEQFQAAQARGCAFQPANPEQIHQMAMQRRVFWLQDQAYLALRPDGFFETAATLAKLLEAPEPDPGPVGVAPPPPEPEAEAELALPPQPPAFQRPAVLHCMAQIVDGYLRGRATAPTELAQLMASVHDSLAGLGRQPVIEAPMPARRGRRG